MVGVFLAELAPRSHSGGVDDIAPGEQHHPEEQLGEGKAQRVKATSPTPLPLRLRPVATVGILAIGTAGLREFRRRARSSCPDAKAAEERVLQEEAESRWGSEELARFRNGFGELWTLKKRGLQPSGLRGRHRGAPPPDAGPTAE